MWVCVCVIVCRHCYGNTQFLHHKAFSLIKLMIKWKFKVTIGGNHNAGYLRKTMKKRRRRRGEVWWVTPSRYTVGENVIGAPKINKNNFVHFSNIIWYHYFNSHFAPCKCISLNLIFFIFHINSLLILYCSDSFYIYHAPDYRNRCHSFSPLII